MIVGINLLLTQLLSLSNYQKRALEAYRGSYISLGKLAEEMAFSQPL